MLQDMMAEGRIFGISPTLSDEFVTSPQNLLSKLSFSHIIEIMTQEDPLARFFYETECIRGTWSVKELRRQLISVQQKTA